MHTDNIPDQQRNTVSRISGTVWCVLQVHYSINSIVVCGIWKPISRTDRVCVLLVHRRVFSRFYRSFTRQDFFNFFDGHRFTEPYIDDSFAAGNDAFCEFFENFHHQSFSGNSVWN